MTNRIRSFLVAAAVVALPSMASAQDRTLNVGYTDIGAVIGLGNIGDAGVAIGGRFERIIRELPELGTGTIGLQLSADVYSYGDTYTFRYIPIGATANYHFNLENKKLVPFVGVGLGYSILSCSYDDEDFFGIDLCPNSGIYFIGKAGARYFFNEKMALYGDVGAGAATLNIGLTFKLR
jgi:hypothetical protein